ncbi:hypothetical protein DFA_06268 [Cavenderia fasciculata]|uniref:Transmembrane protein n=1 Tax=Cavenderia fasciculata TaxID=261658 RepID=F4PKK3_CACFS|nr:uncharacterized protein DFA_06268 [Cavenderia fasciculata]EGG24127.1 hypothetical protein DFA_06268 [Cavenderia fasciculata]|eukprot:XP_004361978.1 hypothetical protein DFA_06268 [Cavenderia fasciculata]
MNKSIELIEAESFNNLSNSNSINNDEFDQPLLKNNNYIAMSDSLESENYEVDVKKPLFIKFYPGQFIFGLQMLHATDPLSLSLVIATLTIVDLEYYEATLLFVLFNFSVLFGRHLIFVETDIQSFLRKRMYRKSSYKSILRVSFWHGRLARLRDITILLLLGFGIRLLYLSYVYGRDRDNIKWRFFDMFTVSCVALLTGFFQLSCYIYCLVCVRIGKETEERLVSFMRTKKRRPAQLQLGAVLLERKYGEELCKELATIYNK